MSEMEPNKVSESVWSFPADSNCYLVLGKLPFVIDTGRRANREALKASFSKIFPPEKVRKVIFTHLHYDHIGGFDLFPNATFHASKEELRSFEEDKEGTVLDEATLKVFSPSLTPLPVLEGFEIIPCPGHTKGSVALWHKESGLLFSGDTMFNHGYIGRTDLPTSVPEMMDATLSRLRALKYRLLCPGHGY